LQQCNNFKDPGVQHYGGEIFNQLRDKIDEIFINLPPPKPSIQRSGAATVVNMGVFHNANAPCFDGTCLVSMSNGQTKQVKDIKKQDSILGPDGKAVKVVCVVKTQCDNNKAYFAQFAAGLRITPYHPVRLAGKFHFPCQIQDVKEYDCPAVYSFVLEDQHIIKINGTECVTWGHDFQDDVVNHPYFGTSAVLADLQYLEGWDQGLVQLTSKSIRRDPKTGLITALTQSWLPGSLPGMYFKVMRKIPGFFKYSMYASSEVSKNWVWTNNNRTGAEILASYAASRRVRQISQSFGKTKAFRPWMPKFVKSCLRLI